MSLVPPLQHYVIKFSHFSLLSSQLIHFCFPAGLTQCHSVVVDSCESLLLEVGPDAIKVDPACQAQCPHLMN